MSVEMCDGTEFVYYITPITKERVKARINWIDEEKKKFGITYVENKLYAGAGNILRFEDKDETFTFD